MTEIAYYKDGVPHDASGQVIADVTGLKPVPLVTDLGNGKFQFKSQCWPCYLRTLRTLGTVWVIDRDDGIGIAACFASEKEKQVAVSLLSGMLPVPNWTPQQANAATAWLASAGALSLTAGQWNMQLAWAGDGVMTLAANAATALTGLISRTSAVLTAYAVGPMVAAATTLLYSPPAGESHDEMQAMFAINAKLLVNKGTGMDPGLDSLDLPVRGTLVKRNGQMALDLLKTGSEAVPSKVRVLRAERDPLTGLDLITVPMDGGIPPRTILVNPAPEPAKPSNTGHQDPVPVTPVHTGTTVEPVDPITVLPSPAPEAIRLQDFIYWRPNAAGNGLEPVYVMLSTGPYGDTPVKGKSSGRFYNPDKAGGPAKEGDYKTVPITREGIELVKLHVARFPASDANKIMVGRLEQIVKGELQPTDTDRRFYTHEIRELERYRNIGVKDGTLPINHMEVWNNAHTAALEDYKINEDTQPLYTPEAIKAYNEQEEREGK